MSRQPRYTVAEARDIARHVVTMRRAGLDLVHLGYHRGAVFMQIGPLVVPVPSALLEGIYAQHGVALVQHFGLGWLPFGLGAIALRGFTRRYVFEPNERIIERNGACPALHDEAEAGTIDLERYANGEAS